MPKMSKKTYFITGGGTGGHIYPAVAVADELVKEGEEIYYIGNPSNLEFDIVKSKGYNFLPVYVHGMPRSFNFDFIKWLFLLGIAVLKCCYYIRKYKPDAVFGTGGYVSAPALMAAKLMHVPYMMHDCDAQPGLVTRKLSSGAKCVSVAFDSACKFLKNKNCYVNGNPIRSAFKTLSKEDARKNMGLENKLTICIMGGSQGARSINDASVEVLKSFSKDFDLQIIFQTGKKNYERVIEQLVVIYPEYENDKKNIIAKYNENGYRDAVLLEDSVTNYNEKKVDIHLKVEEGQKYYLKDVRFVGNTKYQSDYLLALLDMKAGDVYNQKKLEERLTSDEDAVSNVYFNNGYLFFNANPVEVDVDNDSIALEIRIVEGPQATINRVIINGNDRLYEDIVRRELRTKPGQLFSREDLMRSVREIAQMGHFDPENMNPRPIPDPDNGTVDIEYNLVSKANDQIEFSAGWGQTGVIGKLSLKFTNFSMKNFLNPKSYKGIIPQGEGQTLTLSGQTNGRYYQAYSISFMDPWFGGKRPNTLSVSAYFSKQTDISSNYLSDLYSGYGSYYNPYYSGYGGYYGSSYYPYGYGYGYGYDPYGSYELALDPDKSIIMFGLSAGYGKRLNWPDDYFQFMATLNYQVYKMHDWDYFLVNNGTCHNINLELLLQRNSIDNPLYTRHGSQFSLSVAATPPFSLFDGKDYASMSDQDPDKFKMIEYHKWKFKAKVFTPLAPLTVKRTPVLMTRAEFGFVGSYSKDKRTPFETFYMGGDGMSGYSSTYATETIGLRGYENGSIAGNGGYDSYGYAYTRLSMELRYPFILEPSSTIYGLVFVEAGNAWRDMSDYNPFDLKRSAGVGVRIFLPMIGLMGIDWAYGFDTANYGNDQNQRSGSQFHFVIGQEF